VTAYLDRLVELILKGAPDTPDKVLAAFRAVPRHIFVPEIWAHVSGEAPKTLVCDPHLPTTEALEYVYADRPLNQMIRLPDGVRCVSNNSQPSLTAQALAALDVDEGQRILEIGTGTAYAAALLGHLVGSAGAVISVEIVPQFVEIARQAIAQLGLSNITLVAGDGVFGYEPRAPFDRILGSVSFREVPRAFAEQLNPKGRIAIPLRLTPGGDVLVVFDREEGRLRGHGVCACGYQALLGRQHFDEMDAWIRTDSDPLLRSLLQTQPQSVEFVGAMVRDVQEAYDFKFWLGIHEEWAGLIDDRPSKRVAHLALLDPNRQSMGAWWFGETQVRFYGQPKAREQFLTAYDSWTEQGRPCPRDLRMHVSWEDSREDSGEPGLWRQLGDAMCRIWFETPEAGCTRSVC